VLTKEHKQIAEEIMKAGHRIMGDLGRVNAMYFVVSEGKLLPLPPVNFDDANADTSKELMAAIVSHIANKIGAEISMMIDEIWMASPKVPKHIKTMEEAKKWANEKETKRPSEYPDKTEGLIVIVMLPGGETHILLSNLHRDADGKPHLEKAEWAPHKKFETRMLRPWATDA